MKRILLICTIIPFAGLFASFGQTEQTGTVIFEEVAKIEIKLEGEMAAMMIDFPKEQRSTRALYFSPEASLYEKIKTNDTRDAGGFGHSTRNMQIMMSVPENKVFIDLENKKILEQREFMTRIFLITADMPEKKWKISGEQKTILDYPCFEATHTDTAGVTTRVWFTPSITVKSGPAKFCNLPGLVLEVNIEDGKKVYLAQSINFDPLDKNTLKKPKEGKKVTMAEFDEIVVEKMKEMDIDGTRGIHGGRVIIKISK